MKKEEIKTYDNYSEIACPFCDYVQRIEPEELSSGLVSYWGEDEPTEYECRSCEKKFFINEKVNRYWEVAKNTEDF